MPLFSTFNLKFVTFLSKDCQRSNDGAPIVWFGYSQENVRFKNSHGAYDVICGNEGTLICCSICKQGIFVSFGETLIELLINL